MTAPIVCRTCGTLLSPDRLRWVRQGYRVNFATDGTPTRGAVKRPETKGGPIYCRPCATVAKERATRLIWRSIRDAGYPVRQADDR